MNRMNNRPRQPWLDTVRGVTLLSMIAYHAAWDLVHLCGVNWPWYRSHGAYLWQQSICWTFILLSGFCFHLGRRRIKRGLLIFGGVLVTAMGRHSLLIYLLHQPLIYGLLMGMEFVCIL